MVPGPLRKAKRLSVETLQRFGYTVSAHPADWTLDRALLRMLAHHSINCVIDVGAHRGEFAHKLRRDLGYEGRIVSVEPGSDAFAHLARAARDDPAWRVENYALGDRSETAELQILGKEGLTTWSSLHDPTSTATDTFHLTPAVDREHVEVRRLEDCLDGYLDGIIDPKVLLKSDTQGHDMAVIAGAGDRVADVASVVMEVDAIPVYENSTTIDTVILELRERGFDPVGMFPVLRTPDHRLVQADAVFSRRP